MITHAPAPRGAFSAPSDLRLCFLQTTTLLRPRHFRVDTIFFFFFFSAKSYYHKRRPRGKPPKKSSFLAQHPLQLLLGISPLIPCGSFWNHAGIDLPGAGVAKTLFQNPLNTFDKISLSNLLCVHLGVEGERCHGRVRRDTYNRDSRATRGSLSLSLSSACVCTRKGLWPLLGKKGGEKKEILFTCESTKKNTTWGISYRPLPSRHLEHTLITHTGRKNLGPPFFF